MSYPPVRWTEPTGAALGRLVAAGSPPDLTSPATEIGYLATAVQTDGEFGLYRYVMTGPATGPGPHFHRTISESFFVVSGTVRLYDGTRWLDGRPGDFLHVPAGGVHAFRNESGQRAEMLLLFAPGAPRESYFETGASGRILTQRERQDLLAHHDQYEIPDSP